MIRPIEAWLLSQGVRVEFGVTVTDIDFAGSRARRASRIHLKRGDGRTEVVDLGPDDYVFITNGSMTSDATYGDSRTVPPIIRDKRDGSWRLSETLAKKADDFGRPNAFCGNIDETKWESFTLTMTGRTLLDRIQAYTGNAPGEGALMTWKDSRWLLSIVVPAQPHFAHQQKDTYTLWGYALFGDVTGDYPFPTTAGEVVEELRGTLRAVHLDKDWLEVVVDSVSVHVEGLQDTVDDVIGPMVNRAVMVRAVRVSTKKLKFVDIELSD